MPEYQATKATGVASASQPRAAASGPVGIASAALPWSTAAPIASMPLAAPQA